MPTATPFTALGKGNGFASCPSKRDVSALKSWTTLGGFNKDTGGLPTDQQINDSLINLMKLFWNINELTGRSLETTNNGSSEIFDVTIDEEPMERVCSSSIFKRNDSRIIIDIQAQRMYDGPTDDEDNFRGYGMGSGLIQVISNVSVGGSTGRSSVTLKSQTSIENEIIDGLVTQKVVEVGYKTVLDIPFVVTVSGFGQGNVPAAAVDFAALTAEGSAEGVGSTFSVSEVSMSSFDFYTY